MPSGPLELPGDLTDGAVRLGIYRPEDAEAALAGVRDPDVLRFAAVAWSDDTVEQLTERIVSRWPELAREGRSLSCAIRPEAGDRWLGHFVVFGVDQRLGRCEIGFWLPPASRGRGIASRAVELGCRLAFEHLELFRVQATTYVENIASQRTLEKIGFHREGVLRAYFPAPSDGRTDCFMYSRLRSD